MGKQLTAIIHRNWHILANITTFSSFGHSNLYQPIPNPTLFKTTLFTLHKHMAPHCKTRKTTKHTHPHTPIWTYPQWHIHDNITAVVTPVSSLIQDTHNSSWCDGQWMESQDILWRSLHHSTTMWPRILLLVSSMLYPQQLNLLTINLTILSQ